MKQVQRSSLLSVLSTVVLITSACTAQPIPASTAPSTVASVATPTVAPTAAPPPVSPSPTPEPTPAPGLVLEPLIWGEGVPSTATSYAEVPGNLAKGEAALDFRAELLDGRALTLADLRETYWLILPSVAGCGECMFSLYEIAQVYPDYQDGKVKVAFLSIYPGDTPETWRPLAESFADLDMHWGVVNPEFVIDYNIQGLGTILMIDPEGKLVFRTDHPLLAEDFQQLFALAVQ